ncbi:hypothetical protein N7499_003393 [Penicillium canescens]|uniref:Uncharacterized protein n=1 Tax=Penicillium canescens TaxID=5083 RepID=A0AAD6N7Z2_PENCN|nr:hypothetical protein N7460_007813 [Penicillium canescens]KAJ6090679.1 hypothetical protein N7499_003393 [Penicillium canescens]KAJ6174861.1 hypothetical protein N7485_004666 [Penicillium canescens]
MAIDHICPATNEPETECAIFGDLRKRRVVVALKDQARRWVEVDGKQERGSGSRERGATRPGTDMAEQERDNTTKGGRREQCGSGANVHYMGLTSGDDAQEPLVLPSSVNGPPSRADARNNFLSELGLGLMSSVG